MKTAIQNNQVISRGKIDCHKAIKAAARIAAGRNKEVDKFDSLFDLAITIDGHVLTDSIVGSFSAIRCLSDDALKPSIKIIWDGVFSTDHDKNNFLAIKYWETLLKRINETDPDLAKMLAESAFEEAKKTKHKHMGNIGKIAETFSKFHAKPDSSSTLIKRGQRKCAEYPCSLQ